MEKLTKTLKQRVDQEINFQKDILRLSGCLDMVTSNENAHVSPLFLTEEKRIESQPTAPLDADDDDLPMPAPAPAPPSESQATNDEHEEISGVMSSRKRKAVPQTALRPRRGRFAS